MRQVHMTYCQSNLQHLESMETIGLVATAAKPVLANTCCPGALDLPSAVVWPEKRTKCVSGETCGRGTPFNNWLGIVGLEFGKRTWPKNTHSPKPTKPITRRASIQHMFVSFQNQWSRCKPVPSCLKDSALQNHDISFHLHLHCSTHSLDSTRALYPTKKRHLGQRRPRRRCPGRCGGSRQQQPKEIC